MAREDRKKQFSVGKLVIAVVIMALMDTDMAGFLILLAMPAFIGWLVFRSLKRQGGKSRQERPRMQQPQQPLDDCPQPVCFHKDKGMHHVVRGRERDPWDVPKREIDPWDRPDIDIRKYQRR